ncbi:unnamed protein product [Prorocentrum cordatum]|uniref:Uncharacterized protein n=1 Tax=Prorocentrum cordatum TaxID=2364126 RepID=A0ABN9XWD4_9DINO|nr:unnamed protein product [Polarella glacialis]
MVNTLFHSWCHHFLRCTFPCTATAFAGEEPAAIFDGGGMGLCDSEGHWSSISIVDMHLCADRFYVKTHDTYVNALVRDVAFIPLECYVCGETVTRLFDQSQHSNTEDANGCKSMPCIGMDVRCRSGTIKANCLNSACS